MRRTVIPFIYSRYERRTSRGQEVNDFKVDDYRISASGGGAIRWDVSISKEGTSFGTIPAHDATDANSIAMAVAQVIYAARDGNRYVSKSRKMAKHRQTMSRSMKEKASLQGARSGTIFHQIQV